MLAVLDRASGRFLGRAGLKYWPQFDETELGWVLRSDAWGHGYATEAGRACLQWGFSEFAMPYLTAMIQPENVRSIRVAERLGLTPLRTDVLLGDPVVVYILGREHWAGPDPSETSPLHRREREVQEILALAERWAAAQEDVVGLAVVGSWAHGTATIDSDLDLVLLTENQRRFVERDEWTRDFGAVGSLRTIQRGVMVERRLAMFSGLELDVVIGLPTWASREPLDPGTERVVRDGLRILHDPDSVLAALAGLSRS